jgi:putative ABC transport system substrate-binding protein
LEAVGVVVQSSEQLASLATTLAARPDTALAALPDISMFNLRGQITSVAARHRIPAIYPHRHYVDAGGLMSYGTDTVDQSRRAAEYVDRILRGEHPGNLPVQQPEKFDFVINQRAARGLGLQIPDSVVVLADEVVE